MRRFLLIALGALALVVFRPAGAEAQTATVVADLNVRAGPGTGYQRLGVVPAGAPVHVYECSGNWCRVIYGGLTGYVSARYLSSGSYAPRYAAPPPVYVPTPRFYGFYGYYGPRYSHYHRRWYPRYRPRPRYHYRRRPGYQYRPRPGRPQDYSRHRPAVRYWSPRR